MLTKLNYNPENLLVSRNREEVLESIKKFSRKEVYEFYRDGKVKDVLQEIAPGVYEYFDVNDCEHFLEGQKMENAEYCDYEKAKLLKQVWRDLNRPIDKQLWISYPYGVCDNYKQILEREKDIDYYLNSDEKFCILITPIYKKQQPSEGGWRWCKWGEYIGDQKSEAEYLYDEPNIEMVYVYNIYKVVEV